MGNYCCGKDIKNQYIETLEEALKISEVKKQYKFVVDEEIVSFIKTSRDDGSNRILNVRQNGCNYTFIDQVEVIAQQDKEKIMQKGNHHRVIILNGKNAHQKVQKSQGMIIYSKGFYIGEILQKKAHNNGKIYFYNNQDLQVEKQQISHNYRKMATLIGEWQRDVLIKGMLYNEKGQKQYQWQKEGEQTKISFIQSLSSSSIGHNQIKSYKGIVQLRNTDSIMNLFNGIFQIEYINGDKYKGEVVNGKRNTKEKIAEYIKNDNMEIYRGQYKNDMREGKGICEIKHKNHRQIIFVINGTWTNGQLNHPFPLMFRLAESQFNPEQLQHLCTVSKENSSFKVKEQQIQNYEYLANKDC